MPTWIQGAGGASGGTQLTAVNDGTEQFFDDIVSSDAIYTQVEVLANNEEASVTNGLIVAIYLSMDEAATFDWDDEAFMKREFIPVGIGEEKFTLFLPSIGGSWRMGCLAAAATDDYTVDMNFRERSA